MKTTVLDSYALLAYIRDEAGRDAVSSLFAQAHDSGEPVLMTAVNLGEVYYIVLRRHGEAVLARVEQTVAALPIRVEAADEALAKEAALLKATRKMSYADCFAAALARQRGGRVVTGDPELQAVEDVVEVLWIR